MAVAVVLNFPGKISTQLPDEDVIVVLPDLLEVQLAALHLPHLQGRLVVHLLLVLGLLTLGQH